jgi:hypothetical protein
MKIVIVGGVDSMNYFKIVQTPGHGFKEEMKLTNNKTGAKRFKKAS